MCFRCCPGRARQYLRPCPLGLEASAIIGSAVGTRTAHQKLPSTNLCGLRRWNWRVDPRKGSVSPCILAQLLRHFLHLLQRPSWTSTHLLQRPASCWPSAIDCLSRPTAASSTGEAGPYPGSFMAKMRSKSELPTKPCVYCGRPFAWRRKWARDWENVKYCSERCRGEAIPTFSMPRLET